MSIVGGLAQESAWCRPMKLRAGWRSRNFIEISNQRPTLNQI
jgi:hypothetical protein